MASRITTATPSCPISAAGELVEMQAQRKKKFVRGRLDRVRSSPETSAAAPLYYARCGGCQYQHMPYEALLRYKAEILREML
jgi:23S rRNA (uracil1939-C5)-methyltransferase